MAKKSVVTDLTFGKSDPATPICAKHGNRPDALLEILHDVQHELGHVPETSLPFIAHALNLSRAEVYGVATFYHDFHMKPTGKHVIKICRAEACQSAGGFAVIAALEKTLNIKLGETTPDGRVTLEAVYCLGLCPMGPAALIDDQPKAALKAHAVEALVKELA
ncbi:MAG: NAD(P)H-dependent oxidoreductase subunit E [Alphaproteobacteria bacterium]|nr:NAD(P)H-dependent oxidoreductase subunit E [Alphaproteobacteria bacterium]